MFNCAKIIRLLILWICGITMSQVLRRFSWKQLINVYSMWKNVPHVQLDILIPPILRYEVFWAMLLRIERKGKVRFTSDLFWVMMSFASTRITSYKQLHYYLRRVNKL